MPGFQDLGGLLRAVSTIGGGAGPQRRRELFSANKRAESQQAQEAEQAKLTRLQQLSDNIRAEILKNPDAPNRPAMESSLGEINNLIEQNGGIINAAPVAAATPKPVDPTKLTPEASTRIRAALEKELEAIPPEQRQGVSSDQFQDVREFRKAVLGLKKPRDQKTASSSSTERLIDRKLALQFKENRTEREEAELNAVDNALGSKRVSFKTNEKGEVVVVRPDGTAEVARDEGGNVIQSLEGVREDRLQDAQVARNKKDLETVFGNRSKDDLKFLKDTRDFNTKTGRQSVSDERVLRTFTRTLPGVGAEVAQGDLQRIGDLKGVPEAVVVGVKAILEGSTLPPEIRKAMLFAIETARGNRARNVSTVVGELGERAQELGIDNFDPIGAEKGQQFNPIDATEFKDESEFKSNVKVGEWFLNSDGRLLQRKR
jgi:hypothetical protein